MPACCGEKALKRPALKIAELFYSLQGEGALLGVPSFFIRTSGCNLRCAWCDTPYTSWQPEGAELSLDQILDEVRAHPMRHVVVTGGEPMIAPGIIKLTLPMMLVKPRQFGIVSFDVIREFRQSTLNEYNLAFVIMNLSRTSRSLNGVRSV